MSEQLQPLLDKYAIEKVDKKMYWSLFEKEFSKHDHNYLFIDFDKYISDNYAVAERDSVYWHIKDDDKVIAIFFGRQKSVSEFEMVHSVVHGDYRKQGIYSALLKRVIKLSKDMGYPMITSIHSPANNSILIAKMKKGFVLTAMEIDPRYGINACLTYFHDEAMLDAFKLRCGEVFFDKTMKDYSHGSFDDFCNLVRN